MNTITFTDKTNAVFLGPVSDHLGNLKYGGLKSSKIVYIEHN